MLNKSFLSRSRVSLTRSFMTLRTNTQEVEVKGSKIGKMDESSEMHRNTQHLFFLHGILGKGQNWKSFALNDVLSNNRHMYLLDLRNHGESDHHSSMTYKEMANDVLRYADHQQIDKITLLGHNIGAKTAMTLSCMHPDRVTAVISLDTAPVSFSHDLTAIKATKEHFTKIRGLEVEGKTRKSAIETIQKSFSDIGISNFIASNLVYDANTNNKTVKWCINLDAIIDNLQNITGFNDDLDLNPFQGPSLFVNGSFSTKKMQGDGVFPPNEDLKNIYKPHFPDCTVVIVPEAGHFVHTDKP